MRKTEIETTKNFISKQVDSYRAAYGRRVEDHPRQCIFIGTTNSTSFLRDDTGNRRFWPVRLGDEAPAKTVWNDLTEDVVDQLWAEAVARYKAGERLTLDKDLEAQAREEQSTFTEEDPRTGDVQGYLDLLLPQDWAKWGKEKRQDWFRTEASFREAGSVQRQQVCIAEIWQECFGMDPARLRRQDASELHTLMRRMPGWKEIQGKARFGPYGVQRGYERDLEALL